jgi:hypothetical protein
MAIKYTILAIKNQMATKYTKRAIKNKWPQNKQSIFHSEVFRNIQNLVFLVRKYSIWQPCLESETHLGRIVRRG